MKKYIFILLICCFLFSSTENIEACSRFTYTGPERIVITGRSMDWVEDLRTDLWVFPAGIKRVAIEKDPNSVAWTSKYGSLVATAYDLGAADGINSEGLNANLLYLASSNYGKAKSERKNMSLFHWAQYILDNYATVDEAVKDYEQDKFNMMGSSLPNGFSLTVHLSITDKNGDNAIFEYINGKLVVHHGKDYKVMTNEPPYDKQLALNDYCKI